MTRFSAIMAESDMGMIRLDEQGPEWSVGDLKTNCVSKQLKERRGRKKGAAQG